MIFHNNSVISKILGVFILSLFLVACGGGDSEIPSTSTSVPLPVAPGTGTDPGAGTDPVSGTGVATLNWIPPTENIDGSALTDLSGYKIYYGTSANALASVISISNPGLSTIVIDNLANNTTYYFAITAISNNIESGLSNVVSKYVPG